MAIHYSLSVLLFFFFFLVPQIFSDDQSQTFIIHVSKSHKPSHFTTHHHWYTSIIESLPPSSSFSSSSKLLLYSYSRAAAGFSARLTVDQVTALRRVKGIISIVPDAVRYLHTTRTPHFLGLDENFGLWPDSDYADDVIVGMLDTGIWPEIRSFSDAGLSPVPSSWKGICETGPDFPDSGCNRKIIGARAFYKGYESAIGKPMDESKESRSPRDTEGHGTHTASTAAGSVVLNASFYQYAIGVARGMATKARIAAYKICWTGGCYDSDILAAMDQAVADGVHIISLSVGANGYAPQYDHDSIAVGAFGAAEHGVLVSCSAGNSGPGPYTAVNIAPWILTVGASTLDREFPADVVLGDGRVLGGVSLYYGAFGAAEHGVLVSCSAGNSGPGPYTAVNIAPWTLTVGASTLDREFPADVVLGDGRVLGGVSPYSGESVWDSKLPLVYGGDCGSKYCYPGWLNSSEVTGKIVVCDRGGNARVEKGSAVKLAGGVGMILANTADSGEELIADSHLIPATMVGQTNGDKIKEYLKSETSPTATILFRGTVIGTSTPAPKVAAFSSRGPNHLTAEILKPDVIAPGVNILAGWTGASAPTDLEIDPRRVEFNIISGTSMSCPHVSGLAGLLRNAYPNWSPAAIKSALMTTAYNIDDNGKNITDLATGKESSPFIHGAGHVDPNRALNPGLIYDIKQSDYIAFLCTIGYSSRRIQVFVREPGSVDCDDLKLSTAGDLNYPSFSVIFDSENTAISYKRVVKNVGNDVNAVYDVKVNAPPGVEVTVSPNQLTFSDENQTLSYEVKFSSVGTIGSRISSSGFGAIEWSDGSHVVRSPIAVRWRQGAVASI